MKNIWGLLALFVLIGVAALFVPISQTQAAAVTLQWTAPSDDATGVVKYDLRYSTTVPDTTSAATKDAWWVAATPVANMPAPAAPGTTQSVIVTGLNVGTYYAVIRAKDGAGNWNAWSNVALKVVADVTPPTRIVDLIAR